MQNLKFGIITDTQYCDDEPYMDRYLRLSIEKTKHAIDHFNKEDLDFVINLGDMIDHDFKSFEKVLPVFDQSVASVYHISGNHDFEVEDVQKNRIHELLDIPSRGYYQFHAGEWSFIMLNGNEISTYAYPPDHPNTIEAENWLSQMTSAERSNSHVFNGGIGPTQQQWLKEMISQADAEGEKVIICCHFPIYPDDYHNLLNDRELIKILNQYSNVKAWFCGHNHQGNYGKLKFCHVHNFKGMVDTQDENAYAVVECNDNFIYIRGFGRELDRKLKLN